MRQYNDTITLKKNDELNLTIESLAFGGKGIARSDDFVIFVDRALPGQLVTAKIAKVTPKYAEAKIIDVIQQSPDFIAPQCQHFYCCGGCIYQHLSYQQQLHFKQNQVKETLHHVGGFNNFKCEEILPSPNVFYYRNKMEFSFSNERWLSKEEIQSGEPMINRDFALGLHIPTRFDKIVDVQHCYLLSEESNNILNTVKEWAKNSGALPYNSKKNNGYWRFLVIRHTKNTRQIMVNLITTSDKKSDLDMRKLSELLVRQTPSITTILHTISDRKAQIAFGEREQILWGNGYIEELLGDYRFRISANSFFQTNTKQTENLYQIVSDWGNFSKDDLVFDLYCGAGSISIFIARQFQKVVGFELAPQAIEDAKVNCQLNNVENCHFIQGDLREQLIRWESLIAEHGKPTKIVIDPPRSGLHPDLPKKILALAPERIIYVSCNPATLARDLRLLCESDYCLTNVQPVDMFPHTAHCEVVTLLTRTEAI